MKCSATTLLLLAGFLLVRNSSAPAADDTALGDDIARLQKETVQVQVERARNRQDHDRDRQEEDAYEARLQTRRNNLQAETDSVKREISRERNSADSLAALMAGIRGQQHQYELLQNQLREQIGAACDSMILLARAMPPLGTTSLTSALSFLHGETAGKTVENFEALQRLDQVVRELNELCMSVQDATTTPPVTEIKTTANILRIGAILEAAADEKGVVAALWTGSDNNGNPRWTVTKEATSAAAVANAVAMRQGKALPTILGLPFGPMPHGGEVPR